MKKVALIFIGIYLLAGGQQALRLKAQLIDLISMFLNDSKEGVTIYIQDAGYKGVEAYLKKS